MSESIGWVRRYGAWEWRAGPDWCEISRLEDVPDVINEHDDLLVMFLEHAPTPEIARRWFLDVLTDG